jgi:hypothetical protein
MYIYLEKFKNQISQFFLKVYSKFKMNIKSTYVIKDQKEYKELEP